ncbi:RAB-protein geranylgeranyltransferase [Moesziomyces antarcticus]|uniref:Related to Rab geranylgeranyltransferase alpha subunit n=2 Tax=Pseudozyma antarctica TaxID=84753 RepID=A0A5C3FKZ5_PSEA2|nr:RAB-protein geranylgeranyltransferase [Moesziomyces antarcticus]GAK63923.1 RAB-protein geranylgeranyltransferase [Moesziomyces antarcticus]SPO44866.1 related to Rab geranylgeranyltransferase alpha subunit [Moesziomyces antarcticus]
MHGVKRTPKTATTAEARAARAAKDAAKLRAYLDIERTFFEHRQQARNDATALAHTTTLLTLNPELYTVWNYRRDILLHTFTQPVDDDAPSEKPDVFAALRTDAAQSSTSADEARLVRNRQLLDDDLSLTEHALRAHPKVYWIWNHRMWCLRHYPALSADPQWAWRRELRLVEKMLELDARNFHGWNCRRAIIDHLALGVVSSAHPPALAGVESSHASLTALLTHPAIVAAETDAVRDVEKELVRLAEAELAYALRQIERNFSNFSAWHLRSQLLPCVWAAQRLTPEQEEARLDKELELVQQAMYTDPADQSVWFYHRWLVDRLTTSPPEDTAGLCAKLANEVRSIDELHELEPDSKWCAISLAHLHTLLVQLDPTRADEHRTSAKQLLERLVELDPDRAQRYRDLLAGRARF